jgi:hypothetical protein
MATLAINYRVLADLAGFLMATASASVLRPLRFDPIFDRSESLPSFFAAEDRLLADVWR